MKKNNKGFSLVELIVVVLIMGIIAVALAPQVMKWVGTARENSDKNQKASIKSSVQVALSEYQQANNAIPLVSGVPFTASDLQANCSGLAGFIEDVVAGDYPTKNSGGSFILNITTSGKVTVD